MSSHHIVRENQEPALVILNAYAIPFEKVQELLEWMPTILVLNTQLETVLGWGIKVDVILVPAEEETMWIDRTKDQQPVKVIAYTKSESAIDKALIFLREHNIPAVNSLVSGSDALPVFENFAGDIEVFFNNKRWSRIKTGRFEKWLAAGTVLEVLPKKIHAEISALHDGKFVVAQDGMIKLQASHLFWIGEEVV